MNNHHLNEDQLALAVVDESELPGGVGKHLKGCPECGARKQSLEGDLAKLGQMARASVPRVQRKIFWLSRQKGRKSIWSWRFALPLGAVLAAVLLLAFWLGPLGTAPDGRVIQFNHAISGDYGILMSEVDRLTENPFSPFHTFVIGESGSGLGDEFMEFLIPSLGTT